MAGKLALVDYRRCHPALCERGICTAVPACPRKLLSQEAPYEAPMTDPSPCKGCGECARSCAFGAIAVVSG